MFPYFHSVQVTSLQKFPYFHSVQVTSLTFILCKLLTSKKNEEREEKFDPTMRLSVVALGAWLAAVGAVRVDKAARVISADSGKKDLRDFLCSPTGDQDCKHFASQELGNVVNNVTYPGVCSCLDWEGLNPVREGCNYTDIGGWVGNATFVFPSISPDPISVECAEISSLASCTPNFCYGNTGHALSATLFLALTFVLFLLS